MNRLHVGDKVLVVRQCSDTAFFGNKCIGNVAQVTPYLLVIEPDKKYHDGYRISIPLWSILAGWYRVIGNPLAIKEELEVFDKGLIIDGINKSRIKHYLEA